MITSTTNNKVKRIKKLLSDRRFRQRERAFVVEGTRWMDELFRANHAPEFWMATEEWLEQNQEIAENLSNLFFPPLLIDFSILKELASTNTPSGVLAVAPVCNLPWPSDPTFLLLLDQVRDPGNLGTLFRSALAAGVEGVILGPGCVDTFNPKVVRSTMGALLRLPIQQAKWSEALELTGRCKVYLADAAGQTAYTSVNWQHPSAVMVGGEASGADERAKAIVHEMISIPMADASESLNAAVAGSVILFEALRQKGS